MGGSTPGHIPCYQRFWPVVAAVAILWTVTVAGSYSWNLYLEQHSQRRLAVLWARTVINEDLTFWNWLTDDGGVYSGSSGGATEKFGVERLERVSPMELNRQHELITGNTTEIRTTVVGVEDSLLCADIVNQLLDGTHETSELVTIDGKDYLSLTRPLVANSGCAACHDEGRFASGEIAGGLRVAVPLSQIREDREHAVSTLTLAHVGMWLLGLAGIMFGAVMTRRRAKYQRRTEAAARAGERKYRSLFRTAPSLILVSDSAGKVIDCNERSVTTLGRSPGNLIGSDLKTLFATEYQGFAGQIASKVHPNQEPLQFDARLLRSDGSPVETEISCTAFTGPGDGERNIVFSIMDVSAHKTLQRALEASEEKYRTLIENAAEGIFVAQDGVAKFFNRRCSEITGYSPEEIPSLHFFSLVHPDDRESAVDRHCRRLAGEQFPETNVFRIYNKSGAECWVEVRAVSIEWEGRPATLNFVSDVTERHAAEIALRESEDKFRTLTNTAASAIFIIQGDRFVFMNTIGLNLLGYTLDEISGMPFWNIVHPEHRELSRMRGLARQRGEDVPSHYELHIQTRDEGDIWVDFSASRIEYQGQPAMIGTASDITRRKKIEEDLRLSEERLTLALEATSDALWDVNLETATAYASPRFFTMLGYEPNELPATYHTWLYLLHPDDRDESATELKNALASGKESFSLEFRLRAKSGAYRWMLARGRITDIGANGNPNRVVGTLLDVTERREASEALNRQLLAMEAVTDGIALVDGNGRLTYLNLACARLYGFNAPVDLLGRDWRRLYAPEEMARLSAEALPFLEKNAFWRGEATGQRADGSTFQQELTMSQTTDGAVAFIVRDITETKRLQEYASRAQRLETAGRIAAQVAHDFNNLLGPLVAYPDIIRMDLEEEHPAVPLLGKMEAAAAQIADINQQLLTLGRRGHYNLSPLNLNRIVEHVLDGSHECPAGIRITTDLQPDLPVISGGGSQITRILTNLLRNACDAMPDGGCIRISTAHERLVIETGHAITVPRGEYVRLDIADEGPGIEPEVLSKIFDPFFTTKTTDRERGSGLGLSVVHAVVKDHGGHIDIVTRVGDGTTFRLYFPVSQTTEEIADSEDIRGGNEHILVVDDDAVQREVSQRLLQNLGYTVTTVESGERAIAYLSENSADLLLLDMVMDGGIDGTETFRQALEIRPEQRAVVVSGYAETDRVDEAMRFGADGFLKKPLTITALARKVRQVLDARQEAGVPTTSA